MLNLNFTRIKVKEDTSAEDKALREFFNKSQNNPRETNLEENKIKDKSGNKNDLVKSEKNEPESVQNMEIEESDSNEINGEHIRKLFPNLEIPTLIGFSYQEKITRPHLE